jgi:putative intracellular protease/amidase
MAATISQPNHTTAAQTASTSRRDRGAQVILGLCAVGAIVATAATAREVSDAEGTLQVVETWRLAGLPVFAGLFVILAAGLRRTAGLWELVIANKIALVAAGATYLSGTEGASDFVYVDGVLVTMLILAYVSSRGWTAWSHR